MAWVHNLDPFAIQFTETFGIRWYGLAYLSGFVTGYFAVLWMTQRRRTQFKADQIADFVTYVAIGVLAGGRLGYCLFYSPELLSSFDSSFPYWGALKVNEGGMASHGGILGVMAVCFIYGHYKKMSGLHCLDLTVFGSSLGFFFGRLANFINGELYGRAAPESLAWAVKFPQELNLWVQREFERLSSLKPTVEALQQLKVGSGELIQLNASLWQSWLDNYSRDFNARQRVHETIDAILYAIQSGNVAVTEALAPVLTARHPSQLYQALLEGLLVFFLLLWIWRRPQKPGVVAASFGGLYCLARIIGEQFRLPDAHLGYGLFGLTRGQWISLGMLAVAIVFLIWALRRPVSRLGGWSKSPEFSED